MATRLPSQVRFPFGYLCKVAQVSDPEMRDHEEVDAGEDISDGLWDAETRTIYIRKALPIRRKRYVLGHELGHAFLDWQHLCLDAGAMKN